MLLSDGRADCTDRNPQDTRWLPRPSVLTIRTRSVIDCVLEHTEDRTVVFGRDKQKAMGAGDFELQSLDGICLARVVVLVV